MVAYPVLVIGREFDDLESLVVELEKMGRNWLTANPGQMSPAEQISERDPNVLAAIGEACTVLVETSSNANVLTFCSQIWFPRTRDFSLAVMAKLKKKSVMTKRGPLSRTVGESLSEVCLTGELISDDELYTLATSVLEATEYFDSLIGLLASRDGEGQMARIVAEHHRDLTESSLRLAGMVVAMKHPDKLPVLTEELRDASDDSREAFLGGMRDGVALN